MRPAISSKIKVLPEILKNLLLMAVGSILCAIAVNGILIPHQFYGAGFTGISLLIHYAFGGFPVPLIYIILNVPVFALGWMYVGKRFFLYSLPGMILFTLALQFVQVSMPVYDKILSAFLAGIIMGLGSGVILRSLGSAGGLDILTVILLKRFSIRLGSTVLIFNSLILAAGAVFFTLEGALYTLIYIYVNSQVLNLVVIGLSQRKAVLIISREWARILKEILDKIHRGATVITARGGYTNEEQNIIYTVITFRELAQLKRLVNDIDSEALVVVTDTLEVMGQRIGNQPHW